MKYVKFILIGGAFIFLLSSRANACELKGELNKASSFSLGKNECHRFSFSKKPNEFFQITGRQNGVDVELRLFENDRQIKSTDSENLNSGFEFLAFKTDAVSDYVLEVGWVDDNQGLIKNEGIYSLEVESKPAAQQDKDFIDQLEKAKSFYDQATAERTNGKADEAVADYLSAIKVYRAMPATRSVQYRLFLTNYYLGVSYNALRKFPESIAVLEKIGASATENPDEYLENLAFRELSFAYFNNLDFSKSSESLERAIAGFERLKNEKIGEKYTLPSAYITQAEIFLRLNKTEQAIVRLETVRSNFSEPVSENLLASIKLADVYLDLGNDKKAEDIILNLSIPENTSNYIKGVFNKVSGKFYMKTDKEKALVFFNKANLFFAGNENETAGLLMFFGNTYFFAKDYKSAKTFYEQAVSKLERQNNVHDLAQVLNNLAVIYYSQKEYALAISNCETALSLNTQIRSELNQARNLLNLMYFHTATDKNETAIFYGKWSINTINLIKYTQLQGLEKELRDNFQTSFTDAFRKLADLLIKAGRIPEAEQVLRFIKEKEYQDYVRGDANSKTVDYTKNEAILLEEIKSKLDKNTRSKNFSVEKTEKSADREVSPTKHLIDELKAQNVNVSEILFVSTLATDSRLSLIATNDRIQKVYSQEIKRENLNKLIFEFRKSVTSLDKNPKIEGKKLYEILVKPLEKDLLTAKIKKIVWSLDGVLRYIPIPALFDGENYLVQRFSSVQLTFASEEKILMPKAVATSAIGFASSKPFENLSSLPVAKNELDCIFEDDKKLIINSTCKKGIIKGKKIADEDFTQDVFEDALKSYGLIHLTSHFVMQTGDNSKSFLLLGGGKTRKYTMQTFSKQHLDYTELLIMSACNTANFSSDGAEFESFATMAQKQGAKAVIGTLWSVADDSTSKFMTEFYRLFKVEKFDKAEAIRLAQIAISKNKNYAHPFYWSPFVLFGNWK